MIITYKKWVFVIPIIFVSAFLFNYQPTNSINEEYEHLAIVEKIYSSSIVVNEGGDKYYIMKVNEDVVVGDLIKYNAKYKTEVEKGSFDMFYKSTKAIGYGYASHLTIIEHKHNLRNNIYLKLLNSDGEYSNFALGMLYSKETNGNVEMLSNVNRMGIAHLFVISGFHISILYITIDGILCKIMGNNKKREFINIFIISIFLYLIYFPPTAIRALLTMMIMKRGMFGNVDSLSMVGILFFIANPWILFTNSMILSFSITILIYLIKPNKLSLWSSIKLSISAFLVALPTLATWNNTFNILSPLLTVVMTPFISMGYIICLVMIPFHNIWFIGDIIFRILDEIIRIFSYVYIPIETQTISPFQQLSLTIETLIFSNFIFTKKYLSHK